MPPWTASSEGTPFASRGAFALPMVYLDNSQLTAEEHHEVNIPTTMLYRTLAGGGTESWSLILFDHVMLPSARHHVSPRLRDQRVFAEVLYNNPLALTVS